MKSKILVVDDDVDLGETLQKRLANSGYDVLFSKDVDEAKIVLTSNKIDLVVSDIRMPGATGIFLLDWVKHHAPCPVILITGFTDIKNTEEALEKGADGFLPKPFQFNDLLETIEQFINPKTSQGTKLDESMFRPINISTFLSECSIPFHIFLKLSDKKFVKIAYKGEDLSRPRLQNYKDNGVEYLFLKKEDYVDFIGFSSVLSKSLVNGKEVSEEKKLNFLNSLGEAISSKIELDGIDSSDLENAKVFFDCAIRVMVESDEIFALLDKVSEMKSPLFSHSIAVGVLSALVAKKLGWKEPKNMFHVSVGGMLHDIGKLNWPEDLIKGIQTEVLSAKNLVQNHPVAGADYLRKVKEFPKEIIDIVECHHETCDGQGFPKGLSGNEIDVGIQIVGLSNQFIEAKERVIGENKSPKVIISNMPGIQTQYDPQIYSALLEVFGLEESTMAA